MAFEETKPSPELKLPKFAPSVVLAKCCDPPVWRKVHTINRLEISAIGWQQLAGIGSHLPPVRQNTARSGSQQAARVAAERNDIIHARKNFLESQRPDLPDLDGLVLATGGHAPAVRRKRE